MCTPSAVWLCSWVPMALPMALHHGFSFGKKNNENGVGQEGVVVPDLLPITPCNIHIRGGARIVEQEFEGPAEVVVQCEGVSHHGDVLVGSCRGCGGTCKPTIVGGGRCIRPELRRGSGGKALRCGRLATLWGGVACTSTCNIARWPSVVT